MKKTLAIIIPVALCFACGFASAQIQYDSIVSWYPTLAKPPLTPPNWVFPIAWSFLYLCIGLSMGIAWNSGREQRRRLAALFAIQLALNFLWSLFFFYMQNPLLGIIDIIALEVVTAVYIFAAYRVSKVSAYLFVPYALWVAFAAYLNAYILIYN